MATKSFHEILKLETQEQIDLLVRLIEEADARPSEERNYPNTAKMVEEGDRLIDEGFFDNL